MRRFASLAMCFLLPLAACGDDATKKGDHSHDGEAGDGKAGHTHEAGIGKHHGMLADFTGGDQKGQVELKLHDDKGDLETVDSGCRREAVRPAAGRGDWGCV